jgi:hypothetical protein
MRELLCVDRADDGAVRESEERELRLGECRAEAIEIPGDVPGADPCEPGSEALDAIADQVDGEGAPVVELRELRIRVGRPVVGPCLLERLVVDAVHRA